MRLRTVLTACSLAVLLSTAGCSAVPFGDGTDGDGMATPSAEAPYQRLDGEEVIQTHRQHIRDAGTATRHSESTTRIVREGFNETQRRNRTSYVDFGTDPPTRHTVSGDGTERWIGPGRNVSKNPESGYSLYSTSVGFFDDGLGTAYLDAFEFEGPTPVERNGRQLFRYRAPNRSAFVGESDAFGSANVTVAAASVTLYLTNEGLVAAANTSFVLVRDDTRIEQSGSIRYTSVGSTNVSRPAWYDEAVENLGPFAGETVTVERNASELDASLSVTGLAENVAERFGARTELRYSENAYILEESDPITAARASCIPYAGLPDAFENASLTLGYDSAYVPDGDERNLTLFRYNRSLQTVVPVEGATVDSGADTVSAPVDTSGLYLVLHVPTFAEAFGSRELPESATGVPTCR
jgi:hypothetical protein